MATFGIIAALDCEIELYIREFEATPSENGFIYHGCYEGHDVYMTLCGVGKVNAALCTQRLIDFAHPDVIINSGVAGGVSPSLHVCDLAIADKLTYHDFYPIDVLDKYAPHCSVFPSDKRLVTLATAAADELKEREPSFRYEVGCIVSGDRFVEDKAYVLSLREKYAALCTEMEGAAVAHAAYANGVAFIVLRTLSDNADENADTSFNEMAEVAAERVSYITKRMLSLYR